MNSKRILLVVVILTLIAADGVAAEIRVAPGQDVQAAIDSAMPGDVVILEAGTHDGPIATERDGAEDAPIVLRGEGEALLRAGERVVDVAHAHFAIEGLIIDAEFAENRVIRIQDEGVGFRLSQSEVRNARRNCIDIRNSADILIETSLIHHCLNWDGGRSDAHGISAQAVQGLTIRDTEIHTFTGDAFQIDPTRSEPGWDDILIEGCTFWLAPVTDGSGDVPDGVVPGENAIDTKTLDDVSGRLTVVDTVAYGFRNGEISNMAAFNIKETVEAVFDRVTVYDSEIGFRLRGGSGGATPGATVSLTNIVVYDVDRAIRVESDIPAKIPVHHVTFGAEIGEHVDLVDGATADDLDPQNVVVLGTIPDALAGPSTVEAVESDFEDSSAANYVPVEGAGWIDTGIDLGVGIDRRGVARPSGAGPEPGAFEFGAAPIEDMGMSPRDMGPEIDMGAENDMGAGPDMGASATDAGSDMSQDAPNTDLSSEDGCGCSSTTAQPLWPLAILIVGLVRRRMR